jgi:hypothetical protein
MTIWLVLMLGAAASALSAPAAHAGACGEAIAQTQSALDARIAAVIDTARFARDARRAFGLPVPPPGPVAAAENARRDATSISEAVAALARAREADRAGDEAACARALADVLQAVGR